MPKKITVDLNYLRSEGSIALTMKRNCAKWHKDCALEVKVASSRLNRALNNVSKNEIENKLPRKMTRTSLPGRRKAKNSRGDFPLLDLNRFILFKAENMPFWMLYFKLQV